MTPSWRAWRIAPETGPLLAPAGTLYGALTGHAVPWLAGEHTAVCIPPIELGWDRAPHAAPGEYCECGIRGDLDLAALIAYGSPPRRSGKFAWTDSRDVIGEVELSGRRAPRRLDDTPTTVRVERARVGRRVFFARPLWPLAEHFERLHPWSTAIHIEALRDAGNEAANSEWPRQSC